MAKSKLQYLVDEKGKKTAVVLPIKEYEELLEDLEDLALMLKRSKEPAEPWEEVEKRLEAVWRKREQTTK